MTDTQKPKSTNRLRDEEPCPDLSLVPREATGNGIARQGIQIQTMEELWRLSGMLSKAGLLPKDVNRTMACLSIQYGMEIGLPPLQAVQNVAIINGRPCVWGDAALGLCQQHPQFEWIEEDYNPEAEEAVCRVKRRGYRSPTERTFGKQDAEAAGLWGKPGPWKSYPKRMLQMRARSWALRDTFADAFKGLAVAEEVRDIEDAEVYGVSEAKAKTMRPISELAKEREGEAC